MPTIDAGELAIAYHEQGTGDRPPVLLLHGRPDDASTWDEVASAIADAGRRVIVPTLRGFGDTRFRDDAAPRTGNSTIHAIDMIAPLMRSASSGSQWSATTGGPTSPRRWRSVGPSGSSGW